MQIPVTMSARYACSNLPTQKEDNLDSFCDKPTDSKIQSESYNDKTNKTRRLIEVIMKGAKKLGNFMLNCIRIQPSSDEPPD